MRPGREYWKNRRLRHYPGRLVSQFGCFYDDGGGLYTAAYDTEAHTKELLMDRWWRTTLPDGSYLMCSEGHEALYGKAWYFADGTMEEINEDEDVLPLR